MTSFSRRQQRYAQLPVSQEVKPPPHDGSDPPDEKRAFQIPDPRHSHTDPGVRGAQLIEAEQAAAGPGFACGVGGLDGEAGDGPSDARDVEVGVITACHVREEVEGDLAGLDQVLYGCAVHAAGKAGDQVDADHDVRARDDVGGSLWDCGVRIVRL